MGDDPETGTNNVNEGETGGKPVVECSFITEFEDHNFVTVDADAFFFLHDLTTSYLKEKEKVLAHLAMVASHATGVDGLMQRSLSPSLHEKAGSSSGRSSAERSRKDSVDGNVMTSPRDGPPSIHSVSLRLNTGGGPSSTNQASVGKEKDRELHITTEEVVQAINAKVMADKQAGKGETADALELEAYMRDWRDFKCKTWHLEPTVRLLSWAGKSIEPYGIDYILNKLGFSHARTTIPKWLQRGLMDPLDKVQTLLMLQLLSMVREEHQSGNEELNYDG